jgi:hypothetical protein
MTIVFVVTYYKHGEEVEEIFTDVGHFEECLIKEIRKSDCDFVLKSNNYDVDDDDERIYALAETAVRLGRAYVKDQNGSGILKIIVQDSCGSIMVFGKIFLQLSVRKR